MMNTQFADLIMEGHTIIYMDDILIATENDPVVHRRVVSQVLDQLQALNLYLKPSKCIFETKRINVTFQTHLFFLSFLLSFTYPSLRLLSTPPMS